MFAKPQAEDKRVRPLLAIPVWLLVILCSVLPLAWLIWQIVANPDVLVEAKLDRFRFALLGRTLLYNGAVALLATLLALPAALVLGRGRGIWSKLLWLALPVSLLLPSIVYAYGWSQFLRLLGITPGLGGFWDVSRCIWSLATWLWPIPAAVAGLALRRLDAQVQQQALLDGVLWRMTFRQLLAPLIASAAIVAVIAVQEFSVYEPTGISVVATEVRMVFETGAFASSDNPMTAPMGGAEGSGTENSSRPYLSPYSSPRISRDEANRDDGINRDGSYLFPDVAPVDRQAARAGAAVAASLPLLGVVAALATLAFLLMRRSHASEAVDAGPWPAALDAPRWASLASFAIVLIALGVPLASMFLSLRVPFDPIDVFDEFRPQVSGSLLVAGATGMVMAIAAMWAAVRHPRGATLVLLAAFLIGGQLLAIAMIRIYNRRWLSEVYNGPGIVVMAYVGRFGWIALAAAAMTWGKSWRELRDLSAVDGAGAMQTAMRVVWPLAWPILGASAVLVAILSLTEVPATVLLAPQRPPMLTPLMMTWLHMLRSDDMIRASLLMVGIVIVLTMVTVALTWLGLRAVTPVSEPRRRPGSFARQDPGLRLQLRHRRVGVIVLALLVVAGCDETSKPDAIWCEPGTGPVQLVYPRAIGYDEKDNSYFVIDRLAHVYHLDRKGNPLNDWRMPEMQAGKPVGVSIGPDGNVYVPDTHYHRVIVYTRNGKELRRWGSFGHEPGQFIYPTDIDFDAAGNVFVAEYGDNDRIQVFTPEGTFLRQFGKFGQGDGEFMRPQSILVDADEDLVYITDHANHRINVFKTNGTFVRNLCQRGSGLGELRFPYGLAQDSRGRLIVCEFGNNRVQLIDKETGRGIKTWGAGGHEPGQLAYPCGVTVDGDDRVVAVDAGNNRLQVFEF
ncbi:MAG: 6-bladed beta-propeller [Tepidisphaeraceae bacterium]